MSSPRFAANDATRPARASLADAVEECLVRTAEALQSTGAATTEQIREALAATRLGIADGVPGELLETVARVMGHSEEHLGPVIAELGDAIAATLPQPPPLVPFGGKLIAPSAYYDSFDAIHKLGKALLAPVLYAEDTDAIGVLAADRRLGIKPFVTLVRLDYESWTFLIRKHFEL
jgi:hypothetical protein